MAKVLRLHTNASTDLEGWKQSIQIDSSLIQHISDPSGGRAKKVSTSIPTPLARMHLFRTAFEFVVNDPAANLRDNTVYHKMVSQCLDVLELVYNFSKFRQAEKQLLIRRWNIDGKLQQMKDNPQHQLLSHTLSLFLDYRNPESAFYNFSDIYLIYYNYQVIAGTSPFTLFFTLPDLNGVDLNSSKGYRLFEAPIPVQERPEGFQLYLHRLFGAYPSLKVSCKALYEYLTLAKKQTAPALQNQLNELQFNADYGPNNFMQEYMPLLDDSNSPVTVKEVQLATAPVDNVNIASVSDFVLRPEKEVRDARLPLLLKEGNYPGWNYVSGGWKQDTPVPVKDSNPLESRILPGLSDKYPYLTVGDFLEDHLLELPYELNSPRFNYGKVQYQNGAEKDRLFHFNYLLPIRKEFFKYFSYKDLDKYLTFIIDPAYIKVQLSVPVRKGHMILEKTYYENPQNPKDAEGNIIKKKGKIVQATFGLGVFPFFKMAEQEYNDFYKVMLVDLERSGALAFQDYDLRFYQNEQPLRETEGVSGVRKTRRTSKDDANYGSTYYEVFNTAFDYMEVLHPLSGDAEEPVKGVLIPKWREIGQGTKTYTFAVDFGTTNTHIAFTVGQNTAPQAFSVEEEDLQLVMLNKPANEPGLQPIQKFKKASLHRAMEIDMVVNREFVPYLIGGQFSGAEVNFPIRTATCEVSDFIVQPTDMLGNINIGFGINKELEVPSHTSYKTNIKWSLDLDRKGNDRIEVFFAELLRLIKHKVALNDGIIEKTRLVWFAPLSLEPFAFNQFQEKWNTHYQRIFRTTRQPGYLTESAAPFYYLQAAGEVVPARGENLLNIDIGGGSTDVLFFVDQKPAWGSSFRFAGDALWGDGFNKISGMDNGFLQTYKKLSDKPFKPKSISKSSSDAFNEIFNNNDKDVYSNVFIRARHMRILFYLHYTALVYHCGQMMKELDLSIPRYITFSGKGSLYLNFLTGGSNLSQLERLTGILLQEITGKPVPANFKMIQASKPKEATANGGVFYNPDIHHFDEVGTIKLLGDPQHTDISKNVVRLKEADEEVVEQVLENVQHYLDLVLSNDAITDYLDIFAIEADLPMLRESLSRKLKDSMNLGLNRLQEQKNVEERPLAETLFFYPLQHSLYELSKELYQEHYAD